MALRNHIVNNLTGSQAEQFHKHLTAIILNYRLFDIEPHNVIDVMMMGLGLSISDYNRNAPKLSDQDKGALYARLFSMFLSKSNPFISIDIGDVSFYFNREKRTMSLTGYGETLYEVVFNLNDVKRELLPVLKTALEDTSKLMRFNRCFDSKFYIVCMDHDTNKGNIKMKSMGNPPFLVTKDKLSELVNLLTEVC